MADWARSRDANDRAEQMRLRCMALIEKMRIEYEGSLSPDAADLVDKAVLDYLAAARDKIRDVAIPPAFDPDTDEAKRAEERAMVREAIKTIPMDGEVWVGINHALDDAEQAAMLRVQPTTTKETS